MKKCILVVDDDIQVFEVIKDILSSKYELIYHKRAIDAESFMANPEHNVNLVMLDIQLDKRQTYKGLTLLTRINEKYEDLPILMISHLQGFDDDSSFTHLFRKLGADDFLHKDTFGTDWSIVKEVVDRLIEEPKVNYSEKEDVLFIAANPQNTDTINVMREAREIEDKVYKNKKLNFITRWAVSYSHLQQYFRRLKHCKIIHFSMHGSSKGELCFENDEGKIEAISTQKISDLFKIVKNRHNTLKCVILNCCYSELQAKEIAKSVKYVIGVTGSVKDVIAISFSKAFYASLDDNPNDYEEAFKMAYNNIFSDDSSNSRDLDLGENEVSNVRFIIFINGQKHIYTQGKIILS